MIMNDVNYNLARQTQWQIRFYPSDGMLARVIAIVTCMSACLSVCHEPVCQNEES